MTQPTTAVWVSGLLAAAIHILVFVFESLLLRLPAVHHGVFGMHAEDVAPVRLWGWGVGVYNLAIGMVTGLLLWWGGDVEAGRALVVYICLIMVLGGISLVAAVAMGLYREGAARKGLGGAIGESLPALVILGALAF
ncbi:MAG: DUF1304 family protein [Intrasporangium sp.]|uniref:DUF1304 family protein n=1 Tax=Intrasporangium sp. TaxID=1925024 RepID=UPI00264A43F5|nr:DUF1304 family protein [Intrasporangium sp.]MDN5797066.1 DUF1304 family protein [Intrasporangium sp.]